MGSVVSPPTVGSAIERFGSSAASGGAWVDPATGQVKFNEDRRPIFLVAIGESNSGGAAPNANALFSWEIAPRPELPIWLLDPPYGFVPLDIGTNNNIGHGGLDNTTHGWELGIANDIKTGIYGDSKFLYVQTGQGGARIAWWIPGSNEASFEQFQARVAAAEAVTGEPRGYVMLVSLGINDALDLLTSVPGALDAAAYKAGMISRIAAWRAELAPDALCLLLKLPDFYNANGYSDALQEIADAEPELTKIIEVTGIEIDQDHWTDEGYREIAHRFAGHIIDYFGIRNSSGMAWSEFSDAGGPYLRIGSGDTAPQYAYSTIAIDANEPFSVVQECTDDSGSMVIAIADNVNEVAWGSPDNYVIGFFAASGTVYALSGNSVVAHSEAITLPSWLQAVKSGNDMLLQKSSDGGATWATIHTMAGVLYGHSTLYVKLLTTSGSAQRSMFWRGTD